MTANTVQAQAWNGDDGRHFATEHERHERLTARLLDAAAISAGGLGPGHRLRLRPDHAGRGPRRSTRARARRGPVGTDARGGAPADVALSSFGVMFFDDPPAAFANIAAALRPGGRVAFLCWQEAARNEFLAVPLAAVAEHAALPEMPSTGEPGPFSLADPQRIRSLLANAGLADISINGLQGPMRMGADVQDVIGYYQGLPIAWQILAGAGEQATAAALEALRDALRPHQGDEGVTLGSAAWLVTAQC